MLEINFDFVTRSGLNHVSFVDGRAHYMFLGDVALKFVGYRADGGTDWMCLGPKTSEWLRRSLLILEIEAGLHD